MPLMQLSTLVLPDPFGPISANSSPRSTKKETSSSTTRPPNRRLRCSTASSAIPPPRPAILLDLAIGAPPATRLTEVKFLYVLMTPQALAVAIEHDAAVLHHVCVIGNREREACALLDEQDANAELIADHQQLLRQLPHDDRSKAQRQLVHQQDT